MADTPKLRMSLALLWLQPRRPEWSSRWFQLARIVALLLYAYLGLGIVLVCLEDELVFRAKTYPDCWNPPAKNAEPVELTLSLDGDTRVHAWWFEPANWTPARGALLHCHGHGCN